MHANTHTPSRAHTHHRARTHTPSRTHTQRGVPNQNEVGVFPGDQTLCLSVRRSLHQCLSAGDGSQSDLTDSGDRYNRDSTAWIKPPAHTVMNQTDGPCVKWVRDGGRPSPYVLIS